jgi:hypothetical protein
MTVKLGVVCTGDVRVKETLQKVEEVVCNGHTHYQFHTIYSCKVRAMKRWTMQKKKAMQSVHVDLDKRSKEKGSDGGENDKEMAEQVESNSNRP